MEKVLKKYTNIPQHLYVNRQADNQLKSIIEEMQRPGYVLVARQMGKTNLLFNAKRTLESQSRLFAYVDLSNLYQTERECYRNIINSIIEPNLFLFELTESIINKIREKNLPPHNEYSRSLISVLNFFEGDLVIILDEIDALKSVSYSDNIFAQIRSNYFSRTTYPVLERLTYVLSGVIEPTELIKDRNKSPFNIGDKIYLDDFTKEEHEIFIKKSRLSISSDISDAIFDWANGNPRLTFDICAAIEDYILDGGDVSSEILTLIITKKYLTSFDVAPIDHIRELVKSNKDIRKAISHILKKEYFKISDDTKRKLYLYGIINSNFTEETQIKNKIIKISLSEDWIKSIEREKEVSLVFGLAKYTEKDYKNAIDIFNEVISLSNNEKELEDCKFFLGLSYLKLSEYDNAINYFTIKYKNESYNIDSKAYLGVCQIATGNTNALFTLEEAIKHETNTAAYHNALLNLAINIKDEEKSLSLLDKLYSSTFLSENSEEKELNELRVLSLYYQSTLLANKNEKQLALDKINLALEISTFSESLSLIYKKYYLLFKPDETLKEDIVNTIIDNNLYFEEVDSHETGFNEKSIYLYLNFIFEENNTYNFEKLLSYTTSRLLPNKKRYEIIYLSSSADKLNKIKILNFLSKEENIDSSTSLALYRDLSIENISNKFTFFKYFDNYLNLLEQASQIIADDIYLSSLGIKFNYDYKNYNKSLQVCKTIDKKIKITENKKLKFESIIIYYWYSLVYSSLRDKHSALNFANFTLSLISEMKEEKMSMIDKKGILSIKNQLEQIKRSSTSIDQLILSTKFSRNEYIKVKYNDGRIVEKKFKHLELDLQNKNCTVL